MDPYLESRWGDVHSTLVTYIKEAVQVLLPSGLRARTETDVLLEAEEGDRVYRPDVAVFKDSKTAPRSDSDAGSVAVAGPVLVQVTREPVQERRVVIIDVLNGNRLVTAIELLSPSNKSPGRSNERYTQKLDEYLKADVNVVEIDLIRSATRNRLEWDERDIPVDRRSPYYVGVRRATLSSRWEVYPMSLRQPLGRIPIPLRFSDTDIVLDLQPLIDRAYQSGAHDDIDYTKPCQPPLPADDAAWVVSLLAART
jgi:hypothetical protein